MRSKIITAVLFAGVIAVGVSLYFKYKVPPKIKFQSLDLVDTNGNAVKLEDFKGKPLFINFFATWCGPCRHEMPLLEQTRKQLEKDSFVFILISDEKPEHLHDFQSVSGYSFLFLHSKQKLHDLGIYSIPQSYVLNAKQEIVFKEADALDGSAVELAERFRNALR